MTDLIESIVQDVRTSLETLLKIFATVSEEQAQRIPANGGWSAVQVIKHLDIVEAGIYRILTKTAEPESVVFPRDTVFDKIAMNNLMRNRTVKVQAPEIITRNMEVQSLAFELEKLVGLRERIIGFIQSDSFTDMRLVYPHPKFGEMTKLDWLNSISAHSMRHAEQIQEALANG